MAKAGWRQDCPKPDSRNCGTCTQHARTEWRELGAEDVELLSAAIRHRAYASGQSLFAQGDPNAGIYCLSAGTVALRQLDESGNSVLLGLAYPGDVLGYRSLVAGDVHKTSAEALGPCHACRADRKTVLELIGRRPQLGLAFLRRSSREVEALHGSLVRSAVLSNRGRLLQVMVAMVERHGHPTDDGAHALDLPVSRRDLASMIGARHETLSRVMGRLEREELARFSGRHVVIPDLAALVEAAHSAELD